MFLSEDFFPHLRASKEQAFRQELERIRIQRERWVPTPTIGERCERVWSKVASAFRAYGVRASNQPQENCVECLAQ